LGINSFAYFPTIDFVNDRLVRHAALKSLYKEETRHPLDAARIENLGRLIHKGEEGTGRYFVFQAQTLGPHPIPGNFITLAVALSHPLSTGTVHITSSNANLLPSVDHRYLTNTIDLELHARHVRYLETIAGTAPLSGVLKPGGRRNDERTVFNSSLEKATEYVKLASTTNWHSVGTCAMAPREKGGVVGSDLRVHGVKGLRIVDASVIPLIPQSNTQSLVYVIADRASELIAEHWKKT
jgi:choline dehydrogenase-like flavoprotein